MVAHQNMDVYAPTFRVEIEGKGLSPEAIIINHADFSNFEPLKLMAR